MIRTTPPPGFLAMALLLLAALPLAADEILLSRAWPAPPTQEITDTGRGIAVVFSPDLSVEGNCSFYVALGFACFDDASWGNVLDGIREFNTRNPDRPVRTVVLETHGTNGHGLRLQKSRKLRDDRSYISVGALQEQLEPHGVRYVILGSCNSGRLLRPEILLNLNPNPGDKIFLPATRGIIGASPGWDPARSRVTVITPATSNVEMTVVGNVRELKAETRKSIAASAKAAGVNPPRQFAVSDLMMQMITRDKTLRLKEAEPVEVFSKKRTSARTSERLFRRLAAHLEETAAANAAGARVASTR